MLYRTINVQGYVVPLPNRAYQIRTGENTAVKVLCLTAWRMPYTQIAAIAQANTMPKHNPTHFVDFSSSFAVTYPLMTIRIANNTVTVTLNAYIVTSLNR